MAAWSTTRRWTPVQRASYSMSVARKPAAAPVAGLTRFTCEDLPLALLIEFAHARGLPVRIRNGSGTYDSSSRRYDSMPEFRDEVLRTTGAHDLSRLDNSLPSSLGIARGSAEALRWAKPGDVVLLHWPAVHAQVIQHPTATRVAIVQGNFGVGCWRGELGETLIQLFRGESTPSGRCYIGEWPQNGVYDLERGTYSRGGQVSLIDDVYAPGSDVRRWNFAAFDG